MQTSAEQLHHGKLNPQPREGTDERLYIDLDICSSQQCPDCAVQCSYQGHPQNNGIRSIAELATYALVCRRCEDPHCVYSCPVDALSQRKDQGALLVRNSMRCISCTSCSLACPYGTIYPEQVPLVVHNCDFCTDRRDAENEPLCVKTCPHGALRLVAGDSARDAETFLVGDHLIVHSTHWEREKA